MYEIWMKRDANSIKVTEFPSLDLAIGWVKEHELTGSYAVKHPDGKWVDWEATGLFGKKEPGKVY